MRLLLTIITLSIASEVIFAQTDSREKRLIDHARYCLVNDIVLGALADGISVQNGQITCRAGELGLAFIGEKTSKIAESEFTRLRRYVLDGALGESYTCYVLAKGNRVISSIKQLDFRTERKACEKEIAQRLGEFGVAEKTLKVDAVCARQDDVNTWMRDIANAVRAHRKCNEQEW